MIYAIDEDSEKDWITLCNNMLRKRITDPYVWEKLFRITAYINNNEEYGMLLKVVDHLNSYIRSNPSSRTKDYLVQLYANIVRHRFYDNNDLIWKAPYSEWSMQFDKKELYFLIGDGDIIGRYRQDSTIIMGTSGRFYPRAGRLKPTVVLFSGAVSVSTKMSYMANSLIGPLIHAKDILRQILQRFMHLSFMMSPSKGFLRSV